MVHDGLVAGSPSQETEQPEDDMIQECIDERRTYHTVIVYKMPFVAVTRSAGVALCGASRELFVYRP